jgi:hypothetical protein
MEECRQLTSSMKESNTENDLLRPPFFEVSGCWSQQNEGDMVVPQRKGNDAVDERDHRTATLRFMFVNEDRAFPLWCAKKGAKPK